MADSVNNAKYPTWTCDNCPTLSTGPKCACCGSPTTLYPYCLACNEANADCTCSGWDLDDDHPGHCDDCGNYPDGCNCN